MFCILNRSLASLPLVHLFRCVAGDGHIEKNVSSQVLSCRIYHLPQQWILRWEDKIIISLLTVYVLLLVLLRMLEQWSEKTDRAGIQKFLNSKGENEETGAKKLTPLGARHHKISKKLRRSLIFFFPSQTDEKFHWLYVFYSFYSHTSHNNTVNGFLPKFQLDPTSPAGNDWFIDPPSFRQKDKQGNASNN